MATSVNSTPQFTTDKWAANEAKQKADSVTGGVNPNSQLDKDAFLNDVFSLYDTVKENKVKLSYSVILHIIFTYR